MPRVKIGSMREQLIIEQPTRTTDSHGGSAIVWGTLDTVPAELIPMHARESLEATAIQSKVTSMFRIRARGDVTPDMRAKWRPSWLALSTPKLLEIHGVHPDPEQPTQYLRLECGEVATV